MAFNIFASKRLIYKPVEANEEWDQVLLALRSRTEFWNGDIALPTPAGESSAQEYRDILTKHVTMALYICLIPEESYGNTAQGDEQPTAIGTLCLSKGGPENHSHHANASIGIEILPEYVGKGYGSEALKWVQWYAFHIARYHRLEIQCAEWNRGALRLYERLGWKVEGIAREAIWFMGSWHGLVNLGLLEQEWRNRGEGSKISGEEATTSAIAKLMHCE